MSYQPPDLRSLLRLKTWPLPWIGVVCDLCMASHAIPTESMANMPAGVRMPMKDAFEVLASGLCRRRGGSPDGGPCVARGVDYDDGCAIDG